MRLLIFLCLLLVSCNLVEIKVTQHTVMDKGDNTKDGVVEGKDEQKEQTILEVEAGL